MSQEDDDNKSVITELLQKIKKEQTEIIDMEKIINEKKQKIATLEISLWDTCSHCWIRDIFASFDDLCKYYCSKCGLWRDRRIYNN